MKKFIKKIMIFVLMFILLICNYCYANPIALDEHGNVVKKPLSSSQIFLRAGIIIIGLIVLLIILIIFFNKKKQKQENEMEKKWFLV